MATGDYCTLEELKARLWPTGATADTVEDTSLASVITAASREIDNYCGRRFYTTATDETRYFSTEDPEYLFLDDDLISVTSLKTDNDGDGTYEETWATTDYRMEPVNAALGGRPYTWITLKPQGVRAFTTIRHAVQIVGKFGYATTAPTPIKEACILHCIRLFRRKDAPFGVLGPTEMGQVLTIPSVDPDIRRILDSYRRVTL